MHTFGPLTVVDPRTLRPVVGRAAKVVDATTGDPVATYDVDGRPAPVVTGARGQLAQFRADAPIIDVLIPGGDPSRLTAIELLGNVGEVHQTITTGRLSEESLKDTFAHLDEDDELVIDGTPVRPESVGAQPAGNYLTADDLPPAPFLVLDGGQPIPPDTPVGTLIFERIIL